MNWAQHSCQRRVAATSPLRQPTTNYWSCRATGLAPTAEGHLAVAGPSVWNFLPDNLRDPAVGSDSSLKTFLFATY